MISTWLGRVCSDLACALDFDFDLISDPDSREMATFLNLSCGCNLAESEDEYPGFVPVRLRIGLLVQVTD